MRLKNISKTLCLWLISFTILFITGCTKKLGSDETPELKLSTPDETVYTDAIEYSFDIISGAGAYQVKVVDNGEPALGKVTLSGEHVKVDLITEYTQVTVTDKSGRTTDLLIVSSHPSIRQITYDAAVSYGSFSKITMDWGTGKYSIFKSSGDAAEMSFDSNNQLIIKSRRPGRASCLVMDSRGTSNYVMVTVEQGWDLTGEELSVTVESGQYYSFPLKYGEGGWKITHRSSPFLHDPQTCVMPKDPEYREQDVLHIWVPQEANGSLFIQLTDKANHTATITMLAAQKTSRD